MCQAFCRAVGRISNSTVNMTSHLGKPIEQRVSPPPAVTIDKLPTDDWLCYLQIPASQIALFKKLLDLLNFVTSFFFLNYSYIRFMILSLHETLTAYRSVHYIGTIILAALILLGNIIKPARQARSKDQKKH